MTVQILDTVHYLDNDFGLVESHDSRPFEPERYGLSPKPISTGCYRGYFCAFRVVEQTLRLMTLHIAVRGVLRTAVKYGKGPRLFGKVPELSERYGCLVYRELDALLPFSGTLLLGRGGFPMPHKFSPALAEWKYREVHQLLFTEGRLVDASQYTEATERLRAK
jgi:hypothetical protein